MCRQRGDGYAAIRRRAASSGQRGQQGAYEAAAAFSSGAEARSVRARPRGPTASGQFDPTSCASSRRRPPLVVDRDRPNAIRHNTSASSSASQRDAVEGRRIRSRRGAVPSRLPADYWAWPR
ncbi:MAG: hypothetical protein ACLTMP_03640 [Eggerthella lenta]